MISEIKSIDGKLLLLEEAVGVAFGTGLGTVVSCLPGELAYWEGDYAKRCLLLRTVGTEGRRVASSG